MSDTDYVFGPLMLNVKASVFMISICYSACRLRLSKNDVKIR